MQKQTEVSILFIVCHSLVLDSNTFLKTNTKNKGQLKKSLQIVKLINQQQLPHVHLAADQRDIRQSVN